MRAVTSHFVERIQNLSENPIIAKYCSGPEFHDGMTPELITTYQKDALQAIVTRAYTKSPFYQRKLQVAHLQPQDVTELSDLAKLPFTTKEELRQDPWTLLACDKKDISIIHVSTGTTGGEHIYVMQTWQDYYLHDLSPGYPRIIPIEPGDICLNALPYEMSSAGLAFHKTFIHGCMATDVPAGKGGAYSTPEKTVKLMRDLQPTIVMTTPSYSMTLAEAAQEASFDLKSLPLKKMWLTGEGCSPAFRQRVEKIWGTIADFYYGSLECGVIGVECDVQNGYHVASGHVLVEIVDPKTGKVLEPGEIGEIVVTCLLRYDTPLLRYRTEDLGYLETDPCRCGVTLPRFHLRGRVVHELNIQGINFSPFYLEEFLMRLPEVGNWYQFVLHPNHNDRLKIRTELAPGVEPTPTLAEKLGSKMEFGIGIPCEFEFCQRIPRTKEKTIRVVYEEE